MALEAETDRSVNKNYEYKFSDKVFTQLYLIFEMPMMDPSLSGLPFTSLDLSELVVLEGNQNSSKYVETLSKYFLPVQQNPSQ